jgi:hypothetical protein
MSLLTVLITLIVVGVVLYLINNYLPLDGKIKTIINWVVVIVIVIFLLKAFGVWGAMGSVKV